MKFKSVEEKEHFANVIETKKTKLKGRKIKLKPVDKPINPKAEKTLESIDRALARIDAGTYGRDINTGEIIDERRLDILPEAEKTVV